VASPGFCFTSVEGDAHAKGTGRIRPRISMEPTLAVKCSREGRWADRTPNPLQTLGWTWCSPIAARGHGDHARDSPVHHPTEPVRENDRQKLLVAQRCGSALLVAPLSMIRLNFAFRRYFRAQCVTLRLR
jgi:hypothetical protein